MEKIERLTFTADDGTEAEFYVEDSARVNGTDYLLVTDSREGDAAALILKDLSDASSEEADYVIVTDDAELQALLKVFQETSDEDTRIEL